MSDLVVTVPKGMWKAWLTEGDCPGEPPSPLVEYFFYLGRDASPVIAPGERVYVVSHGRLRGYAPLVRIAYTRRGRALVRQGGAVAVTIPETIPGFRGYKLRWWDRSKEIPFPNWKTEGVTYLP